MQRKYSLFSTIAAIAAIATGLVAFAIPAEADSATGDPTIWGGSLVLGQVSSELFTVPAGTGLFVTSFEVDTLGEKPNVFMTVTDPFGAVIACPVTPATLLHVSECAIPAPVAGVWTVTVGAPTIVAPSVGYTVEADTEY